MTQTVPAPSLPPDLVHLLETYCIGRKLGGGSFGTVRGSSELLWLQAAVWKQPQHHHERSGPVRGLTATDMWSCTPVQRVQQPHSACVESSEFALPPIAHTCAAMSAGQGRVTHQNQ